MSGGIFCVDSDLLAAWLNSGPQMHTACLHQDPNMPCRASGSCARYVKADLPLLDAQSSHASVFVALAGVLSFLFLIISVAIIWQMRKRLQGLERQQWYAVWACMTAIRWCSCMMPPAIPDQCAYAGVAPRPATIAPSERLSFKGMLLMKNSPDAVPGQAVCCCQSGS